MKKLTISKLFVYRHRFVIGYILLALAFASLVFILPLISPEGLSNAEMQSAVTSSNLHLAGLSEVSLVDLPYHTLQKISITVFGLSAYAIRLPSILVGLGLSILLILLLNRWFKNNVALLASIMTVLSTPFLYLAGSGTPLIMLVFWPTLLLWLGSKIQGVKKPRPLYSIIFALIMLASVFTPYLAYLDLFILIFALAHPHLRFTIKNLPKIPLILTSLIITAGLAFFTYNLISRPSDIQTLLLAPDFDPAHIFGNFKTAIAMLFSWNGQMEGIYLVPLISLATAFLALAGLLSTAKGFFASRNAIASYFIIFTLLLASLNPDAVLLIILPLAILTAHGFRYILQKWYGLFPENPYARIAGLIPISIFIGCIIITSFVHYVLGYRYNPIVANNFENDLSLVHDLDPDTPLFISNTDSLEYQFYSIPQTNRGVLTSLESRPAAIATLGKSSDAISSAYKISTIITSPKSDSSDRIYIYKLNEGE